jgi:hypothetical protein
MLYAGRARAATTRSCDRFRENGKNDGCDGPTSDYSRPADKCAARRRAAAALDRLDGWVKARSFFCCSLLVVSRRGQKAHGCALGVLGVVTCPTATAASARGVGVEGDSASLRVWLAAPAKPNSAATQAATMSWAGLVRMHDPHASRARRSAVESCSSHPRVSPRPKAERPNATELRKCRARAVPVEINAATTREDFRPIENAAIRRSRSARRSHIDTLDHVECAGQIATHGDMRATVAVCTVGFWRLRGSSTRSLDGQRIGPHRRQ